MRTLTPKRRDIGQTGPWTTRVLGFAFCTAIGLFAALNPEELEGRRLPDASILGRRLFGIAFLLLALVMVLRPLVNRISTPGPRPLVATLDDGRATLLRRGWLGHAGRRLEGVLAIGGFAYIGCFLFFGSFDPLLMGLTGLIGVGMIAGLAWLALPGQRPGRLLLRPTGVTELQRGREATVRWDDVVEVEYGPGLIAARTHQGAPVTSRKVARGSTGGSPHLRYRFVIETQHLGVDTRTLALTLQHYAATPFDRHELGTDASLSTIEALGPDGGPVEGTLTVRQDPDASRPAPARPRYPRATVLMDEVEEADPTLLLERTQEALAAAGASDAELAEYWAEATGDDDRHVLATTRAWVTLVRE